MSVCRVWSWRRAEKGETRYRTELGNCSRIPTKTACLPEPAASSISCHVVHHHHRRRPSRVIGGTRREHGLNIINFPTILIYFTCITVLLIKSPLWPYHSPQLLCPLLLHIWMVEYILYSWTKPKEDGRTDHLEGRQGYSTIRSFSLSLSLYQE